MGKTAAAVLPQPVMVAVSVADVALPAAVTVAWLVTGVFWAIAKLGSFADHTTVAPLCKPGIEKTLLPQIVLLPDIANGLLHSPEQFSKLGNYSISLNINLALRAVKRMEALLNNESAVLDSWAINVLPLEG